MGIKIDSRDWQDHLDKMERIAVAMEAIAKFMSDADKLAAFTKLAQQDTAALTGALPKTAP